MKINLMKEVKSPRGILLLKNAQCQFNLKLSKYAFNTKNNLSREMTYLVAIAQ